MKTDYRILYLEEREGDVGQVADLLKREYLPGGVSWVKGREAFQNALKDGWSYDLLLLADPMAGFPSQEALAMAKRCCPNLPVILLADQDNPELAAESVRQGATEVVAKSGLARLAPAARRALREVRDQAALRQSEAENARLTAMLRTILDSTAEGILVVDLAGQITTYNRKFMSLCGIPEYVMAPMDLERVLRFLQDQFVDPETFLSEARILGDRAERKPLGFLLGKDQRTIEAFGRSQRLGQETVGKIFSFMDVTDRDQAHDPLPETLAVPPDLMAAARAGRVVPWYLSEEELVVSAKGEELLALPPGGLPRDLAGLEALIHHEDLDRFRRSLEHPRTAPFELRMLRGDGSWITTRWNMKKGSEGYRGVFSECPEGPAPSESHAPARTAPSFNFRVQVLQD